MPGSQSSLREANRQRLLGALERYGAITQVELAEVTGLSAATVSTIVKELLGTGEVDTRNTVRSGRRAQLVRLAQPSGLGVGVHVGRRSLRVLVGDQQHDVLAERSLPLPGDHRVDTTLDRVALLIVDLVEQIGSSIDEVGGIGVVLPAPVDPRTGLVSGRGVLSGWEGVAVGEVLSRRVRAPVVVENDATAALIAESRFGAARGCSDVVYVRASHLTGAGMLVGGRVHRGRRGIAGEIGHVEVDAAGAICQCGSRGCLNTVVGADALVDLLRISRSGITLRDLVALANEGDPGCRQVVADAGATIGSVVAGLALAFDPECVVVGGELAETGEILLGPLREAIRRRVMLTGDEAVRVLPAELGQRAEVRGAAALAFDAARPVAGAAAQGGVS